MLLSVLVVAGLVLSGCGGGDDEASGGDHGAGHGDAADFPASEADTALEVSMKDFVFQGLPATVTGSKVFLTVANQGPAEHELVVFDDEDKAMGGIEELPSGQTKTLALELEPGTYTAKCLIDVGGKTHAELGMQSSFTVG